MIRMKRIFAFVLAALMCASAFAGCNGGNDANKADQAAATQAVTEAAVTEAGAGSSGDSGGAGDAGTGTDAGESGAEADGSGADSAKAAEGQNLAPMTISFATDQTDFTDDYIAQQITSMFNITLDPIYVEDQQAREVLAASGGLPDMWGQSTFEDDRLDFFPWIAQGIIRSIPEELIRKYPNVNKIVTDQVEVNGIKQLIDNKYWYIPCVRDIEPYLMADGARIYYRKDWAENLGLPVPKTMEDLYDMAYAFSYNDPNQNGKNDTIGMTAAGGVLYLVTMFGLDPESWTLEDGKYIPSYYSDRMLAPLEYCRRLYADGCLDPEYAVTKYAAALEKLGTDVAGIVVRNGGDSYWLNRTLRYYSDAHEGLTPLDAWNDHIGIMPIPIPENSTRSYWPCNWSSEGRCFNAETVDDAKLDRILSLFEYSMTEEAREYSRYGVEGETYSKGADGKINLFIDPATNALYDLARMYPMGGTLLGFVDYDFTAGLDTNIPSVIVPQIKEACGEWNVEYDKSYSPEGDAALCRFISTPAKDDLQIEFNDGFSLIIMGSEPVKDMFEKFKADCRDAGIEQAIGEVTEKMKAVGK